MKPITLLLMILLLVGCMYNPFTKLFTKLKEEKTLSSLKSETVDNSSKKVFFAGKIFKKVEQIPIKKNKLLEDVNCSNFFKKPYRKLVYIKPLTKDATKKEILEYIQKFKTVSKINSVSIVFNRKVYYCWAGNYIQNIYDLANVVRDKNISMDILK